MDLVVDLTLNLQAVTVCSLEILEGIAPCQVLERSVHEGLSELLVCVWIDAAGVAPRCCCQALLLFMDNPALAASLAALALGSCATPWRMAAATTCRHHLVVSSFQLVRVVLRARDHSVELAVRHT
eukprot:6168804-Prymnesium_polylepis.1